MKWNILKGLMLMTDLAALLPAFAVHADGYRPIQPTILEVVAATDDPGKSADVANQSKTEAEPTPEQKMQARFPQPTMVGHLIGLPVLDGGDSTIGYVKEVVKDPDGKIKLIVPYAKWFGWVRNGSLFAPDRRLVAVPIETVAILALQIDALDMDRDAFDKAPTWSPSQAQPIPSGEIIKIAIQRR